MKQHGYKIVSPTLTKKKKEEKAKAISFHIMYIFNMNEGRT